MTRRPDDRFRACLIRGMDRHAVDIASSNARRVDRTSEPRGSLAASAARGCAFSGRYNAGKCLHVQPRIDHYRVELLARPHRHPLSRGWPLDLLEWQVRRCRNRHSQQPWKFFADLAIVEPNPWPLAARPIRDSRSVQSLRIARPTRRPQPRVRYRSLVDGYRSDHAGAARIAAPVSERDSSHPRSRPS